MTVRVKVLNLVLMWKIPLLEKDRAITMGIIQVGVAMVPKILRLERTVVIRNRTGIRMVYAINVNITSQITPVIEELQMI
jgi:hypothetical protein